MDLKVVLPLFEHIPAAMGDQQHQKVGEKRRNDHEVENGGASKEPRVDSTDAQILMVGVEQRNHYREVWKLFFFEKIIVQCYL